MLAVVNVLVLGLSGGFRHKTHLLQAHFFIFLPLHGKTCRRQTQGDLKDELDSGSWSQFCIPRAYLQCPAKHKPSVRFLE